MKYAPILSYCMRVVMVLLCGLSATSTYSQFSTCPPNLDFENGNFTNWKCLQGHVYLTAGENVPELSDTVPTSVHKIISADDKELDMYGRFPKTCPNGSRYGVMLGNFNGGHEAEGIYYTFTVPSATTQFSITYNYAVVLENPGHSTPEQPRFRARIIDVANGTEIDCVSFDFAASSSLPGFKVSPIRNSVVYKDWTPVTVDLTQYAGKTLKLEFITSDCTNNQHFGYAYVDVNSNCSNSLAGASLCGGDDFITLAAPYGFQSYQWYMNNDYNTLVADTITTTISPVPLSATTYSVIVTPYPGYGCIDTFVVPLKRQPKPVVTAGPDQEINCNTSIQLGSPGNSDYLYSWTPSNKLSNAAIANPWTDKFITSAVNFVVKVIDKNTGCISVDSAVITPVKCFVFVPTAFTPNGDGLNDKLTPHAGGIREFKRFSIYSRHGNMVFTTTKEGEGWDGTYRGAKLDPGVFVWLIEYISMDNRHAVEKGTLTLIR